MSFIAVGIGLSIAGSAVGAISANKAKKEAERREAVALEEYNRLEDTYSQLDTSNPYANMENTMEDLTIDQRGFDLAMQKHAQSQGNILQDTTETAGSSGISVVAQGLAEEGKLATESAGSTIGMQEQENQGKERSMATNLQFKEREGEVYSRSQKKDIAGTLLGMSQQEVASYREQVASANEAKWKAISGGVESIGNMLVQPPGTAGPPKLETEEELEYPDICPGLS